MTSKHQLQEENSKVDFTKIIILSQRNEMKRQSTLPIDKWSILDIGVVSTIEKISKTQYEEEPY